LFNFEVELGVGSLVFFNDVKSVAVGKELVVALVLDTLLILVGLFESKLSAFDLSGGTFDLSEVVFHCLAHMTAIMLGSKFVDGLGRVRQNKAIVGFVVRFSGWDDRRRLERVSSWLLRFWLEIFVRLDELLVLVFGRIVVLEVGFSDGPYLTHEGFDVIVLFLESVEEGVEAVDAFVGGDHLLNRNSGPARVLLLEIVKHVSDGDFGLDVVLSFDILFDVVDGQGFLKLILVSFSGWCGEPVMVLTGVDLLFYHLIMNYKHYFS
jgi:hypothetical protein